MLSPPKLTVFIDRCLGKHDVADTLRGPDVQVELHDDHFTQDCEDEEWIPPVVGKGWLILTKDQRVRRRENELESLRHNKAAAFILTGGNMSGESSGQAFLAALPKIQKLAAKYTRPLIATVSASGSVKVIEGTRRGGVRETPAPPRSATAK